MGFLSCLEPQHHLAFPHTPPDLLSLGCSSSASYASFKSGLSTPSPKDLSWLHSAPPISPPMSSHDHPPPPQSSAAPSSSSASGSVPRDGQTSAGSVTKATAATTAATTPGVAAATAATSTTSNPRSSPDEPPRLFGGDSAAHHPRQQLPSLSSLFGPPEAVQPLHASPLERPQAPTAALTSATAGLSPPPPLPLERQQSPPSSYYPQPVNPPATGSRASPVLSQPPRHVYDSARSADDQPSLSAYQQQQPPLLHRQERQIDEREPPNHASHRLSPRAQDQPHPLQQRESPSPSYQWSDSRPTYVAASKWPQRQEDSGGVAYSQVREQSQQQQHQQQQQQHYRHHQHDHHGQQQRYRQPPLTDRYAPLPPPGGRSPASEYENKPYHSQPPPPPPLPQPSPRSPYGSDYRAPMRSVSGPSSSVPANAPSTPGNTSSTYPDGVPVKDGLGPKIWKGTHFLPRFVRAAEVAGEGMCYFYDDGSHCKTVIDGEVVNAHWGVTKAGKPRKRLAIACVTCREKKIKCDPDYPRCVQCEKLGLVCKFKNAPRGGNNVSPGAPAAEPADSMRRTGSSISSAVPSAESPWSFGYPTSLESPRMAMTRPGSSDSRDAGSNKRMRTSFDNYTAVRARSPPATGRPLPHPSLSETSLMPSEMGRGGDLLPPLTWGSRSPQRPQSQPRSHSPPPARSSHSLYSQSDHPPSQRRYGPPPPSPPPADLPRIFLPPPRSLPDLPRKHNDMLMRPWHQDVKPHGRA